MVAPGSGSTPAMAQSFFFRELSFSVGKPRPDLPAEQTTGISSVLWPQPSARGEVTVRQGGLSATARGADGR